MIHGMLYDFRVTKLGKLLSCESERLLLAIVFENSMSCPIFALLFSPKYVIIYFFSKWAGLLGGFFTPNILSHCMDCSFCDIYRTTKAHL
jgi:hypothetical protein